MTRPLRALADPFVAAVLLLGALLCLGNLGGRGLWQDEAETAVLARRVLTYGVPLADDGRNPVSAELGRDRTASGVWNWSPWLPIYACAASLRVFGESEAAARLPFALAGWLCLPLVFLLSRRWFDSLWAARLSTLTLTLSTPFLLAVRQARGYAFVALEVIVVLLCLDGLLTGRRKSFVVLVVTALALFYTNYFVAIGLLAAVAAASPLLKPGRKGARRLALALAAVALGVVPGAIYFRIFSKAGPFDFAASLARGGDAFVMLFAFVLPWPVLFLLRRAPPRVRFLFAVMALYAAYLALAPWLFFRYVVVLAPAAAVLTGAALDRLRRRSRALAVAAVVLLASDLPAQAPWQWLGLRAAHWADPGPAHLPWWGLVGEISRGYPSCGKAAALYLKEHAAPNDVVLTNYGDAVLMFYSGLRARGGDQGPPWPQAPDWAVMHPYEISRDPGRDWSVLQYFRASVAPGGAGYSVEPFVCRDPVLADAPDPGTHLFAYPAAGSSAVILKRRASDPPAGSTGSR